MRGEAGRYAPRTHVAPDLSYPQVAIEVNEIDRKLHAEGVHSSAGEDPQACPPGQGTAAEQSFSARRAPVGYVYVPGKFRLASEIPDPKNPFLPSVTPKKLAEWHLTYPREAMP